MKRLLKSESLSIGLAMFAMFFGAGNIIFPLALGQYAGDKNFFAIIGLIITAAVMPMIGIIAMILFDGDYRSFFGRLGKYPGLLLALFMISLLGPLGSTPRCIVLAYSTLKMAFLDFNLPTFSAISCLIIYLFTMKQKNILKLLGWVLTPLLLLSLLLIILIGLFTGSESKIVEHSNMQMFLHGLNEGYNTMDLLAAFFFSSTIITILKIRFQEKNENKSYFKTAMQASVIGASLLTLVYIGFSYIAAFHGNELSHLANEELLSAMTIKIAGPYAGILICIAIALACLTTAIALISAFTVFFQKEILRYKLSYQTTLILSLILTFFISMLDFNGISSFLWPILQICYPGLIVLTFLNIANRLVDFKPLKGPVAFTFGCSLIAYMFL